MKRFVHPVVPYPNADIAVIEQNLKCHQFIPYIADIIIHYSAGIVN